MGLRFLTSGESHGPTLVAILEGLPAGLDLTVEAINAGLARRQHGLGAGPRMKIEKDTARLLGGVMAGQTTGAPVAILIENLDHVRWRGHPIPPFTIPRPGHADLSGAIKYGHNDLRPVMERASARETAARVAVGMVCQLLLDQFDIHVGGYVVSIGDITADLNAIPLVERPIKAAASPVRCPDPSASERMEIRIRKVMQEKDTLGGVIEVVAWGVPPGLGSYVQWDRRLDARLGAALLSIPAIKGVEIGPAFENTRQIGSQIQDPIRLEGDQLVRPTDRSGGLEGGITTGQPVTLRAAMKPIATTLVPQQSVDLAQGDEVQTQYERSDFCPVPRAVPVLEAMTAFVLADALIEKLGGDSLDEMRPRFKALRRARLEDLKMDGVEVVFWPEDNAE
jgi:chorismate synthase